MYRSKEELLFVVYVCKGRANRNIIQTNLKSWKISLQSHIFIETILRKTEFQKSLAEILSIAKISKKRGFYGKNIPTPLLPQ